MQFISSKSNRNYKCWQKMVRGKGEFARLYLLEGLRLCRDAWQNLQDVQVNGLCLSIRGICVAKSALIKEGVAAFVEEIEKDCLTAKLKMEVHVFDDYLFEPLAETQNSQGLLMAVEMDLPIKAEQASRLLVLDSLQDPGNLGAIWRSADAFGFDGLLLTKGSVLPQNRKVLRAAMGSVFHVPVAQYETWEETFAFIRQKGFKILAASLQGDELNEEKMLALRLEPKLALVIGNEGRGLSQAACRSADAAVKIPMSGQAESLNAACAASILCFALRKS